MATNVERFNAIIDEMRKTVIGGLVSAQIGKCTLDDIIEDGAPAFDGYTKEEILGAFIGFAMNVSVTELERQGNEKVVTTSEEMPVAKGGDA